MIRILLVALLLVACETQESTPYLHTLVIIETYEEDVHANDGSVEKDWMTVFILGDSSRHIQKGKWGDQGDTLKDMIWDNYSSFVSKSTGK